MQNLRRIIQGLFLLLFLFLFIQTESKGNDELGYPVRLFLDFDPLILITTLLSAHAVAKAFLLSLVVIVLSMVLGRVFCGWVCPLGTLHNLVGSLGKRRPARDLKNWHRVKYYLLIGVLASAVFTLQPVGIMDPISLLIRSFSLSVYPLFNYAVRSTFDAIYSVNPLGMAAVSEPVYTLLKKSVLSFNQAIYNQSVFIGILFLAILSLNLVEKRFWCRYLCPLGALLGLLSRFSLLKRS
ncbi:MAG: 4Fe-4S binding protein, partial [Nitrospirae bacterium]|nr:4Fe-4S binding protein [Nitrospirota bacterium]